MDEEAEIVRTYKLADFHALATLQNSRSAWSNDPPCKSRYASVNGERRIRYPAAIIALE